MSSVPILWGIYKRATSAHWTPDVVNVAGDSSDWNHLDQALKTVVLKTIAFLTTSEKVLKGDLVGQSIVSFSCITFHNRKL